MAQKERIDTVFGVSPTGGRKAKDLVWDEARDLPDRYITHKDRTAFIDNGFAAIIENKHNIAILFYIYLMGPCGKTDLYTNISKNPNRPDKIVLLEKAGLIRVGQGFGNKKTIITLTEFGRWYTTVLLELEKAWVGRGRDGSFQLDGVQHSLAENGIDLYDAPPPAQLLKKEQKQT
ncbi:MAG: hypothetical protein IJ856_07250 [Candidatus Methanomethylophilaceae archaeon]|nr:hypothetical protein [Candidatus Methanomethylophilaceae archaeon]